MAIQIPTKVRGFVVDKITGHPLTGIVVTLLGKPDDNVEVLLGILASDQSGYVSFDLKNLQKAGINNLKNLWLSVIGDGEKIDIPSKYQPDPLRPSIGFQFLLKVDKSRCFCNINLPSVQDVDIYDWELSPYSFSVKSSLMLGEDCCETPAPSHIAEKDFRFYKVVRRSDKQDDRDEARDISPINVSKPPSTSYDNNLAIRFGEVLEYRQRWFPLGHSLGQVVYSLPLAPCESVNIAVIDWSRQDTTVRTDDIRATETLFHEQRRDREIEETIESALTESQGGWSLLGGYSQGQTTSASGSASATVPIKGIPVNLAGQGSHSIASLLGIGGGITNSWGNRDLTGSSLQELQDTIAQATSVTRTLKSTIVIQATQDEQNVLQTRTITNHNHCHALTVQYYEVLRNFKIKTEFIERRPVVLLPYALFNFTWELALQYRSILEFVLIDKSLQNCFDGIARFHYCTSIYKKESSHTSVEESETDESILRYQLTLETGDRETWGAIWVKLIHTDGSEKELFFKESVKFGGGGSLGSEGIPGYELPKNSKKVVDIVSGDAIGLKPEEIKQVKVEWVEANGNDAWDYKGIGVSYSLSSSKQGKLFINDQEYYSNDPFIIHFDDSGHTHQVWTGNARGVTTEPLPKPTPDSKEEGKPVLDKAADECCEKQLLAHLNFNLGFYNRAIWLLQDPSERRIQLEDALQNNPNILNGINEWPIAVSGNYIAFSYDDSKMSNEEKEKRKKDEQEKYNKIEPSIISLPTRGLFAEAQLGHCNSCEVRDVTRFWKWEESPCEKPPSIEGITPGPKGQAPQVPQPAALPSPVVNVMQAPAAPDPVGLAAALKVLGTTDIFRDMSGITEVSKLLDTLAKGTVTSLEEAQKIASEAQNKLNTELLKSSNVSSPLSSSQSPEVRNDNLQVARQAAQVAKDLGLPMGTQEKVFTNILGTDANTTEINYVSDSSSGVGDAIYFKDLIEFEPEQNLLLTLQPRQLNLQRIEDGYGDVNLDLYKIEISVLPKNPATGNKFKEEEFFDQIRKELATLLPKFHNYPGQAFQPYEQIDDGNWKQFNPKGAVMQFNIDANPLPTLAILPIPEWGLVLCAELIKNKNLGHYHWKFVTLQGPNPYGYHPVSGTREFGLSRKGQGFEFYVMAADRASTILDYGGSYFLFNGAELFWNNFFKNLLSFIQANQGQAIIKTPYSKRHPWNLVRRLLFGTSNLL